MRRIGRVLRWLAALLGAALLLIALTGWILWNRQGLDDDDWAKLSPAPGARVQMDEQGIPTIEAADWDTLIEAQGYVSAANRLFQMDLQRRAAAGRLAEWFGAAAVPTDTHRRVEDWPGVARRIAERLPEDQRRSCEAYARGVNHFIEDRPWGWGLEYLILRVRPEPWTCADTTLVLLSMTETLSNYAPREAQQYAWRQVLPPAWAAFLLPQDHPWNQPLFGEAPSAPLALPTPSLPPSSVELVVGTLPSSERSPGSNNWAWRGPSGTFVANDPHLGANVPHLWFLVRLRRAADDWVVGASIPGMPGVVLGMNPHLAWAFTNVGEDVDDYLIEEIRDGQYRTFTEDDAIEWTPLEHHDSVIHVRDGADVPVQSLWTSRGPLVEVEGLGTVSHQWLPYLHPAPSLPTVALNRATSWEEINAQLDRFTFPAQNVVVADRHGGLGYRTSGTGVIRQRSGLVPVDASVGAWLGFQSPDTRPRVWHPNDGGVDFFATANARIWVDEYGHHWANDQRIARIREVLSGGSALTVADMQALQLDTTSAYHKRVLSWVADNALPADGAQQAVVDRWRAWDGRAEGDPVTFTEAVGVEKNLRSVLLGAVHAAIAPSVEPSSWRGTMDSAWVLTTLDNPEGVMNFGLAPSDLATWLLQETTSTRRVPYPIANRWKAQHPFVGRVPYAERIFSVDEPEQYGFIDLVRTEEPRFGASLRVVWSLSAPMESLWVTPVGQSGHARSPHYKDLQTRFHSDERMQVFPKEFSWEFEPN